MYTHNSKSGQEIRKENLKRVWIPPHCSEAREDLFLKDLFLPLLSEPSLRCPWLTVGTRSPS